MIEYQLAKLEIEKFSTTDSISAAHGLLCGYACVNPDITLENWLFEVLEEYHKDDDFGILAGVFNQTLEQLSDPELNFNLLIDEDEKLQILANHIKDWCDGFLIGLGLAKVQTSDEEILEIIENISQVAGLDANISDNESNSQDLIEVIEFLRMGVLLIQETLNPSKQDFVSPLTVH